jgi:hypothetical protein
MSMILRVGSRETILHQIVLFVTQWYWRTTHALGVDLLQAPDPYGVADPRGYGVGGGAGAAHGGDAGDAVRPIYNT